LGERFVRLLSDTWTLRSATPARGFAAAGRRGKAGRSGITAASLLAAILLTAVITTLIAQVIALRGSRDTANSRSAQDGGGAWFVPRREGVDAARRSPDCAGVCGARRILYRPKSRCARSPERAAAGRGAVPRLAVARYGDLKIAAEARSRYGAKGYDAAFRATARRRAVVRTYSVSRRRGD
jgi:hypothetical protein